MHSKEVLGEGKYYRMVKAKGWEYVEPVGFSDVVLIIPVTDDGRMVLIEQYRVPADKQVFEIPAGLVGDKEHIKDENIIEAARRELIEETGYDAKNITIAIKAAPNAGSNTLEVHMLLATGLKKVGNGGGNPEEGENIKVYEVPLAHVRTWLNDKIAHGHVVDLKVYAGLFFAMEYWNEHQNALDGHNR
ncbi:MAG TPA: NUDIX hydrolase [Phycisphaerae bacterium]|nr:NUDIX hydrolase [Phycisphaerae bacterium]HPS52248.1 NUDIX hydrolase [Phycisphaerae bacterium]